MVVDEILKEAKVPYRRSRYTAKTLPATYAVYTDDRETDGPDNKNWLVNHQITIELYESAPDPDAESAIENALDDRGIPYEVQDRYWLQEEQRYQVIYEFNYIEKRRG